MLVIQCPHCSYNCNYDFEFCWTWWIHFLCYYFNQGDVHKTAREKVSQSSGTVRLLSKSKGSHTATSADDDQGLAQVVSEDGTPHCVHCLKPYQNHLLQQSTIRNEENAWQLRFCSQTCSHQYWVSTKISHFLWKKPNSLPLCLYVLHPF